MVKKIKRYDIQIILGCNLNPDHAIGNEYGSHDLSRELLELLYAKGQFDEESSSNRALMRIPHQICIYSKGYMSCTICIYIILCVTMAVQLYEQLYRYR